MSSEPKKKNENIEYTSNLKILSDWFYEKEIFQKPRYLLEDIRILIINSVNWQQYGISNEEVESLNGSWLLGFEGQGQGGKDALITLPRNKETYELFLSVMKWRYLGNKSWDFENSVDALYYFLLWLNNHLLEIIKEFNNALQGDKYHTYIETALACEIYRKILIGEINVEKINQLRPDDIIGKFNTKALNEHSSFWNNTLEFMNNNDDKSGKYVYDVLIKHFNLTQGSGSTTKFIDFYNLEKIFDKLKKQKFIIEYQDSFITKQEKTIFPYYKKIYSSLIKASEEEIKSDQNYLDKVVNMLGIDADFGIQFNSSNVKNMLDDIITYYTKMQNAGLPTESKVDFANEMKSKSQEIATSLNKIAKYQKTDNLLDNLIYLSGIDLGVIRTFVSLLDSVNNSVKNNYAIINHQYDDYIKRGNWKEDPRFEEYMKRYEESIEKLEGLDE